MKTISVQQYPSTDPVGFVNITSDFDIDFLKEQYNLEPFNMLNKQIHLANDDVSIIEPIEELPSDNQTVQNKQEEDSKNEMMNYDGKNSLIPEKHNKRLTVGN